MQPAENPEFEMYRQRVLRRRRVYAVRGWEAIMLGGLGAIFFLVCALVYADELVVRGPFFLLFYTLVTLGFLGISGLGLYWRYLSRLVLSTQEIQREREQQRRLLFRQAQGQLPLFYRFGAVFCISLSLCLLLVGGFFLFSFGPTDWDGWGYMLLGFVLLAGTFYLFPREKQRILRESATRLTESLLAGEASDGAQIPSDNEHSH